MNKLSKSLNLKHTKFGNPHGLPHQDGRSTSYDVAKLCCTCMKIDLFRIIIGTRAYKCVIGNGDNKYRREV